MALAAVATLPFRPWQRPPLPTRNDISAPRSLAA